MENNTKRGLHLTLMDNETGRVIFDGDGRFFIGAFCGDEDVAGFLDGEAKPYEQFAALQTLQELQGQIFKNHPNFKNLLEIAKLIGLDTLDEAKIMRLDEIARGKEFR